MGTYKQGGYREYCMTSFFCMIPPTDSTDTIMVAETQQLVNLLCECTPIGCGPWPPENLGKYSPSIKDLVYYHQ